MGTTHDSPNRRSTLDTRSPPAEIETNNPHHLRCSVRCDVFVQRPIAFRDGEVR